MGGAKAQFHRCSRLHYMKVAGEFYAPAPVKYDSQAEQFKALKTEIMQKITKK
jgi:hypothetical protein